MAGRTRDYDFSDADFPRHRRRVQRTGAAIGEQGKIAGIKSALGGDAFHRIGHFSRRDAEDAVGGFGDTQTERIGGTKLHRLLGRHLAKLRRVLAALGRLDRAVYIERASLPNQRVEPLAQVDPASVPYFATALIWDEEARP